MCEIFTAIGSALGASAGTAGATGVAAVGTAVSAAGALASANAQRRAAKGQQSPFLPKPPAPQAQAYSTPTADSDNVEGGATNRRRLRVDLATPRRAPGAGLQVSVGSRPGAT